MELSLLHFSHPLWLWAALAVPAVWIVYFLFYRINRHYRQLEKFIDPHLLPYLLVNRANKKNSLWKHLLLWSAVWSFLTIAVAGPRWSYREIETFSKDQSLVILLDLSESMNASDVKPSRLVRAKQKIEDLINLSRGVKIGLIAFAADPHMIAPLTDDIETIRHLLPSIDTGLVYVQGSRLSSALDMAYTMLEAEPGNNKALLVISDGGFEDASAILTAKKLAEKGIAIHAMGVGTVEGAPLKDHKGNIIKKNGTPVLSKLEKEQFSEISKIGNGHYLEANYSDHDEDIILRELESRAEEQMALGKKNTIWDERFYWMIFPVLPIILWWFRRGAFFALALFFFFPAFPLQADAGVYFKNTEQLGKEALEEGDYETAVNLFQDPYRKGVSCYKAGHFAEAEKLFRQSNREEVASSAAYNIGNSLVQQQKLKEAITAYEDVLKQWPDHTKAKENLELVKKMLEEQKQENSDSENPDQQEDQNKENEEKENSGQNDQGNKDQNEDQGTENKENESRNDNEKNDKNDSGNENEKKKENESEQENNSSPQQDNGSEEEKNPQGNEEQQNPEPEPLEDRKDENQAMGQKPESPQNDPREGKVSKTQEDHDADLLLNRINNDPKTFMKNKFYIESKKNGTTEGLDPW